jgi:cytochrome P450
LRFFQLSASERAIKRDTAIVNKFADYVIHRQRRVVNELMREEAEAGPAAAAAAAAGEIKKKAEEEVEEYQFDSNNNELQVRDGRLGPDLLTRFIDDAARKERDADNTESRTGGTDQELRDILLNFMSAGRDTTACALSWTLYELIKHPRVADKVREEFHQMIVDNKGRVTYDEINKKLQYAHAVALEVQRLHPSVPKDAKYAIKDDVLPDGTRIPAGACVSYCSYAMGRDENLWEDVDSFKPERFLNESGTEYKEPSVYAFPVFNAGPRLCLGKPLALLEIKLVTGMMLNHFDFEFVDEAKTGRYASSSFVLPMKSGLRVKLTPRC